MEAYTDSYLFFSSVAGLCSHPHHPKVVGIELGKPLGCICLLDFLPFNSLIRGYVLCTVGLCHDGHVVRTKDSGRVGELHLCSSVIIIIFLIYCLYIRM